MADPSAATLTAPGSQQQLNGFSLLAVTSAGSRRVALPAGAELVIGRGDDASLRLDEPSLSRRHAAISVLGSTVHVRDLESRNGTKVNGAALKGSRELSSGDVITLGDVTLVLVGKAPAPPHATVSFAELSSRLAEELARAALLMRPSSVARIRWTSAAVKLEAVAQAVAAHARVIDVLGSGEAGELFWVLPELDAAQARELVGAAMGGLRASAGLRAGVASCPESGTTASTLLAAARAASEAAAASEARLAATEGVELEVGDQRLLVAEPVMSELFQLVRRLAPGDLSVLVWGETGAGKELVALALHHWSKRAAAPFVGLNCAAMTETLLDSELFGHERGAFTGAVEHPGALERAGLGTLFLDEVADLSPAAQAKLLRAIETRRFTRVGGVTERKLMARVVCAANRDLEARAAEGAFRRDLLFRIAGASLYVPPLRERPREIVLLARRFLDEACARLEREPMVLPAATVHRLLGHPWPGNARELKNLMDYAAHVTVGSHLSPDALAARLKAPATPAPPEPPAAALPLADELAALEQQRMQEALDATRGNQRAAAERIGMPLRTFVRRLAFHRARR